MFKNMETGEKRIQSLFNQWRKVNCTQSKRAFKANRLGVYEELRQKTGGIGAAASMGDLPRGKHQVYNATSRASQQGSMDDVDDLLRYAHDEDDLVLHHSDFPEDLWVLGTSSMGRELVRSTTSDILSHPFSMDPTIQSGQVWNYPLSVQKPTSEIEAERWKTDILRSHNDPPQ